MATLFEEGRVYTMDEISAIIRESQSKPVIGQGVETADKRNNAQAVKDIMKDVSQTIDKSQKKDKRENPQLEVDRNKTTLDPKFDYEPSKEYKDRVETQAKGFPSKENEKNSDAKDNESLDFDGNKKFYDNRAKQHKETAEKDTEARHAGLKSHNLPKEDFEDKNLFKESKKMKKLCFRNTEFITEERMMKFIPDDYKKDGNRFIMEDKTGDNYIVEYKESKIFPGLLDVNTTLVLSEAKQKAEFERMAQLAGYRSSDYQTKGNVNENMRGMINRVRELNEKFESLKKTKIED
ncbi:MAG: hypothetical protein LUD72_04155 [Bacteroidales bacterium]|nr:hypothetical protein [Bacteroidales bacterium]